MAQVFHRRLFLEGPAGRLEASLWTTSGDEPPLAAVVCHPHPLFGGTMHNNVVFQVAKTLHHFGVPVLRFNFRGAGLSAGEHDRGRGEREDVCAALDWLAGEFSGWPLLLAGFSFGAWVGLQVGCEDARVRELVGLGLPVNDSDLSYLASCSRPKLLLQGDRDQFGDRMRLEHLVAGFAPEAAGETSLVFVAGADHFFTGKLAEVDRALATWLVARHPALSRVEE